MDMLKEIERIEALAENKRDNVKLANFWKSYALEMRDEKNAEISNLKTQLQNWKDFCKKVQRQQLAKPVDDQLKAEREKAIRACMSIVQAGVNGYDEVYASGCSDAMNDLLKN